MPAPFTRTVEHMKRRRANSGGADDRERRRTVTPGRVAAVVLALAAVVFVGENTRPVKVRLLVPEVTVPLWTALLAMAAIGWLCGALLFARRR